ncbi:hypothetical protein AMATHDRAFT_6640 [Amanita thiersii Skay4041]|uniref:Inhibitor I9 domain-containing protein n=1 Tax=Amanita thiersii Skay4041 TaxID=703135 RepID=A0A2A9N9D8_9AGAR|nr:hypothetical protein AMATHDRAFT_6640 [Amanita thiersii Skay4041]
MTHSFAGGQVKDEYTNVLKGFSATMPNSLAANFERNDLIEFIEPDTMVTIM